ncbi:hypothetical protein ABZY00_32235 [Streptomyces griseoflavus]|uniref:hypothetical protein n=1 Tax=Streptomyces griseoflavus TaxID=35619 RepID=UPI0033B9CCAC
MKIASYLLLAVSLIAMAVANSVLIISERGSPRRRSAQKVALITAPFVALGIVGVLMT